jgi:hypothetical protein
MDIHINKIFGLTFVVTLNDITIHCVSIVIDRKHCSTLLENLFEKMIWSLFM